MTGKETLDDLLNALLSAAIEMLERGGSFLPFAYVTTTDEEIEEIPLILAEDEVTAETALETLTTTLRLGVDSGRYLAVGICADMEITDPRDGVHTDAILAMLEHREGTSVDVFLPYSTDEEGKAALGELFAVPGEGTVFGAEEREDLWN